jgi:hypothetical protein
MSTDDTETTQVLGTRDISGGTGRVLGTLGTADGEGVVTMRERFSTDIEDLWDAITDPERLARWLGTFTGELKLGATSKAVYFASGWEGEITVVECEPPKYLKYTDHDGGITEVWLSTDGDAALLIAEQRGMPIEHLKYYGPGVQVHIEDLISYLAGGERFDSNAMCEALEPAYAQLASELVN